MTSRLILPEHYVKGNTQLAEEMLTYIPRTNNKQPYVDNKKIKLSTEIRPPSGAPVVVNFNILVVDINSINVEDMDFR